MAPYIIAQVVGGIVAGVILYVIASGKAGFDPAAGFASNGYGDHSPGGYSLLACFVCEVVMTMIFLFVIMRATDKKAPQGFAPIAIGLCLTLIHLISIPVTNTSVNPPAARGWRYLPVGGHLHSSGFSGLCPSSVESLEGRYIGSLDEARIKKENRPFS